MCLAPKQTKTSLKLQQKEMWFAELILLTLTPVIDFAFMVQCHHSYCCNIFCCLKQIKCKNSSDILWISKFVDEVVETKNRAKRDFVTSVTSLPYQLKNGNIKQVAEKTVWTVTFQYDFVIFFLICVVFPHFNRGSEDRRCCALYRL